MKLYRLHSLANDVYLDRAIKTIESGLFWCSSFSEFNDPMEGVFNTTSSNLLENLTYQRYQFKICSLTNSEGIKNPALWGYYAGAFKGIAIEVSSDPKNTYKVEYKEKIPQVDEVNDESLLNILKTKLTPWSREKEYRFIKKSEENKIKIGEIEAVHYFIPYENVDNRDSIQRKTSCLSDYIKNIKKLKECMPENIPLKLASLDQARNTINLKTNQ